MHSYKSISTYGTVRSAKMLSLWKTIYFRYPFHIGLQEGVIHPLTRGGLLTNLTTLADELRSEGYSTHAVGKWHLGSCNEDFLPTSRGFDHHYGYWLGAEDYYQHTRTEAGHAGYDFRDDLRVDHSAKGVYSSVLFGKKSSQIIENHNQSNPLFLYLPFQSSMLLFKPLKIMLKCKK